MRAMPRATVIVCTHNRAAQLAPTIVPAATQAAALGAEVLVVDNASTDATATVLAELIAAGTPALRTVHEPTLGLSHARNRGMRETGSPLLVFLDDDAVPRPGWLAALLAPFAESGVWGVGGRIALGFTVPPPAWLSFELHGALSAYDLGEHDLTVRYGKANYPHGGNMALRADAARIAGGFSSEFGLQGRRQLQHEETDLFYRLEHTGGEIRYAASAVVDHQIAGDRLTPDWFLARHWYGGQSAAHFILRNRGLLRALWRLQWWYGKHLLQLPYHPKPPLDGARLAAECRRREALGYLVELARLLPALPGWRGNGDASPAPVHH